MQEWRRAVAPGAWLPAGVNSRSGRRPGRGQRARVVLVELDQCTGQVPAVGVGAGGIGLELVAAESWLSRGVRKKVVNGTRLLNSSRASALLGAAMLGCTPRPR